MVFAGKTTGFYLLILVALLTVMAATSAADSSGTAAAAHQDRTDETKIFKPLFLSHGGPPLLFSYVRLKGTVTLMQYRETDPTHSNFCLLLLFQDGTNVFLRNLGTDLGKPKAIVIMSAHWETKYVEDAQKSTLYPFPFRI